MKLDPIVHEWTKDDLQYFYTALDQLHQAMCDAGANGEVIDSTIAYYFEQKRAGQVEPGKVVNRIATATNLWNSRA